MTASTTSRSAGTGETSQRRRLPALPGGTPQRAARVRSAVATLVHELGASAAARRRAGHPDPLPDNAGEVYTACVTVVMRVIVACAAQARGLAPGGDLGDGREGVRWDRALAVADLDRSGFLAARDEQGTLVLAPPDRAVRELLHAAQDCRDAEIEQIGYVYESLLDHTCVREGDALVVRRALTRKRSGAHYTPRDLADEVVRHALDPLCHRPGPHQTTDRTQWMVVGSKEILDLRVADIACGAGVFLVAAARYLADRLVQARALEGVAERYDTALREVIAHCLYGVDIDPMAVWLCRASLWLLARDATASPSFMDGRIRCGDALVGLVHPGERSTVEESAPGDRPLHWVWEFPEIVVDRGGFDAVVGNPPFVAGSDITGAMGTRRREWIVRHVAGGRRGNADLAAYFFLRAHQLLRPGGSLGLLATNTIAQGDTREVGLDQLVAKGFTITRAVRSAEWPAPDANLEYAAVWGSKAPLGGDVPRIVDGEPAPHITALLEPAMGPEPFPRRLVENEGVAFHGSYVLGMGFVLDPAEAHALLAADPRNREVVKPYLNGDDLSSRPDCSPSRWVIDFHERSLEEAASYPLPFARVRERVLPERASKPGALAQRWWLFKRVAGDMRAATAGLDHVLVIARVSKAVLPVRIPTGAVISEMLIVFATDSFAELAMLSSSLHWSWAVKYGSTLETRVRYTPQDVFGTFPRPAATAALAEAGRWLDTERREIMTRRGLGLTDLYNRVNDPRLADEADPDIALLRRIHVEVDEALVAAHGWSDVDLGHGWHSYRQMTRWMVSPAARLELMDRLLRENLRRAAQEPRIGSCRRGALPSGA